MPASILVVEDEPSVREILTWRLMEEGYNCQPAPNALNALDCFQNGQKFDLMMSDIRMPGMSGIDLLKKVRALDPDLAVIMVTAVSDMSIAIETLKMGASDYITKPFNLDEVCIAVERALEKRSLILKNREYQLFLEDKVEEQTVQIKNLYLDAIKSLVSALEAKDKYTEGHSRRVTRYAVEIARIMGISREQIQKVYLAGLLHDIGKIGIPDGILHKPGPLTKDERRVMERHCEIGERILTGARSKVLGLACSVAASHHEKWNGSGYPRGIAGREIALEGRIVALVDVFDALVSERCYKPAFPYERAIDIITSESGRHFDPDVVDVFLSLGDTVRQIITHVPPIGIAPPPFEELEAAELAIGGLPALLNLRPEQ